MPQKQKELDGAGIQISWQNLIMTVGLIVVVASGFWSLGILPIQQNINDLKQQISALHEMNSRVLTRDDEKFLTQKEHNEFKLNVRDADTRQSNDIKEIRTHVESLRTEAATRQDVQNALNTTRVEFLAEIKRLDQKADDSMKRPEFFAWKKERDRLISIIEDRLNNLERDAAKQK